jgi:hypothetical protein
MRVTRIANGIKTIEKVLKNTPLYLFLLFLSVILQFIRPLIIPHALKIITYGIDVTIMIVVVLMSFCINPCKIKKLSKKG